MTYWSNWAPFRSRTGTAYNLYFRCTPVVKKTAKKMPRHSPKPSRQALVLHANSRHTTVLMQNAYHKDAHISAIAQFVCTVFGRHGENCRNWIYSRVHTRACSDPWNGNRAFEPLDNIVHCCWRSPEKQIVVSIAFDCVYMRSTFSKKMNCALKSTAYMSIFVVAICPKFPIFEKHRPMWMSMSCLYSSIPGTSTIPGNEFTQIHPYTVATRRI